MLGAPGDALQSEIHSYMVYHEKNTRLAKFVRMRSNSQGGLRVRQSSRVRIVGGDPTGRGTVIQFTRLSARAVGAKEIGCQ